MTASKKQYTEEFRRLAVARMQGCRNVAALAEEMEAPRRLLYRWRVGLHQSPPPLRQP